MTTRDNTIFYLAVARCSNKHLLRRFDLLLKSFPLSSEKEIQLCEGGGETAGETREETTSAAGAPGETSTGEETSHTNTHRHTFTHTHTHPILCSTAGGGRQPTKL